MQIRFALRIAQNDRVRLEVRGCLGKAHLIHALFEIEGNTVPHDREILVIDRQRRRGGRGDSGKNGQRGRLKKANCFHTNTPVEA